MISQELHTTLNWADFQDMQDFIEQHGYAVMAHKETETTLKDWIIQMVEDNEVSEQDTIDYFENL